MSSSGREQQIRRLPSAGASVPKYRRVGAFAVFVAKGGSQAALAGSPPQVWLGSGADIREAGERRQIVACDFSKTGRKKDYLVAGGRYRLNPALG